MVIKKQPDSEHGKVAEAASDWFRQFLKHLEIWLAEAGRELPPDSGQSEYAQLAVRALKLTLLDSGLDEEQIRGLFGRSILENASAAEMLEWNAERNERRFKLIDRDIQGMLSGDEKAELTALTQLMRAHIDSEQYLPLEGARKLHKYLAELDAGSLDSEP